MTDGTEDAGRLLEALRRPAAYPEAVADVQVIETHISVVFLAGDHAYKIKKPVDLGFLDFSSLERRRRFCEEELRLNRRLAPELYLDVLPVTRGPEGPRFGGRGEAIEYAVRMRRFDQADQLDRLLAAGSLTPEDMDEVAIHIAAFHDAAAVAPGDRPWGRPSVVDAPVRANFATLEPALAGTALADPLARLADWRQERLEALAERFERRRANGRVRECHGDLHLRNMARIGGRIVAFDSIEFEPSLRWIDVASDSAFLLMDLCSRGRSDLGWRFMNGWLSATGDYDCLDVLDWYLVYRHLVRAKVDAIRLGQGGLEQTEETHLRARIAQHLDQAEAVTAPRRPFLLLTHGLSGSGKSWVAQRVGAILPAVVLRSDVERKRLFKDADREDLYTTRASDATYARLGELAHSALEAGYAVIVDAAFLERARRDRFRELGQEAGVPCGILSVRASRATLEARVRERAELGRDPSDAGLAVLAAQCRGPHELGAAEVPAAIEVDSERPLDLAGLAGIIRQRLRPAPDAGRG